MIVYSFGRNDTVQRVVQVSPLGLVEGPGRAYAPGWEPFEVELVSEIGRRRLQPADAPDFDGRFLVLKDAALPRAADLLASDAEFLPLRCPQEPLTLVNVLTVIDAVDQDASEIRRFPDGRVKVVDRFVLRPDAVPTSGVFRVPESLSRIWCTDSIAALLRERLTGLNLQPVWEG